MDGDCPRQLKDSVHTRRAAVGRALVFSVNPTRPHFRKLTRAVTTSLFSGDGTLCILQVLILLLSAVLLAATPSAAHRSLTQVSALLPEIKTPQIPASLPVDGETKSLLQGAINDVFSAFSYSSDDQQKMAQTPKPQPGVPAAAAICINRGLRNWKPARCCALSIQCRSLCPKKAGTLKQVSFRLQCTVAPTIMQCTSKPPAPPAMSPYLT